VYFKALKIAASLIYDCGDTQLADQGWGNVKRVLAMELSNADFTEGTFPSVVVEDVFVTINMIYLRCFSAHARRICERRSSCNGDG
jgi:hypothetical protein